MTNNVFKIRERKMIMVKKCFKKMTAMLLVVMMLMATFTVMPVEAKTLSLPEFDTEKHMR